MCQNAPNPISISIFSGDPHHWGLCPQTPGEGKEGKGEGKGRGGKREGGVEGRGGGTLRHCPWSVPVYLRSCSAY